MSGGHYNLNIIGFAQCQKNTTTDPNCFNGNAGDIQTNGHTLFVPLKTAQTEDICASNSSIIPHDPSTKVVTDVGYLYKGVRILVSDGDRMQIVDRDATDGTAQFIVPNGCYNVYARALGKPGGCMDIDTLICYDETSPDVFVRTDCSADLSAIDRYVLVGHIDVDRSTGKPHWSNVTNQLLNSATGVSGEDYFTFLWEVYNDNLRLCQIRFYPIACP